MKKKIIEFMIKKHLSMFAVQFFKSLRVVPYLSTLLSHTQAEMIEKE